MRQCHTKAQAQTTILLTSGCKFHEESNCDVVQDR